MSLFFSVSIMVIVLGAGISLFCGRRSDIPAFVSFAVTLIASMLCLFPVLEVLLSGSRITFSSPLPLVYGVLEFKIDTLSAIFFLPLLILAPLGALYGAAYMKHWNGKRNLGVHWFFYDMLVISMMLVLSAANGILFIMVWELMALSSFVLLMFEHDKRSVRRAGWVYLCAGHIGVIFIFAFFAMLSIRNTSFSFDMLALPECAYPAASILFIFALIGFGLKAGVIPLHVWLPEAHPVAPSHVSALMSGVMIKMGIYGILRALTFLGAVQTWWGMLLLVAGVISALVAVSFAMAQHDMKRLLAYSSVENIGIIFMGMGLGLLGASIGSQNGAIIMAAGFGAAVLHVINHAFFKGLMFLGAGSVLHSCGTLDMNRLGGLMKRMPWTASSLLGGAAAISGLPPFNGFVSEFLIYFGCFYAIVKGIFVVPALLTISALALTGGLAMASFTKLAGTALLGEPRSESARHAHENSKAMLVPMMLLLLLCPCMVLLAPRIIMFLPPLLAGLGGIEMTPALQSLNFCKGPLWYVAYISAGFAGLSFCIFAVRVLLPHADRKNITETWGCGYLKPDARIQYTASSFVQPLTDFFWSFLRTVKFQKRAHGIFPKESSFSSETPDIFERFIYGPVFMLLRNCSVWLHIFQSGRVQLYIMYIAVILVILLCWKIL